MPRQIQAPSERFWAKVNKDGPIPEHRPELGPCWMWTGETYSRGYGQFRYSPTGKGLAHRYSHELLVGPISEGLEIDHLCQNRLCVNPAHLEPVTGAVNKQRAHNSRPQKTHCPNGHPYDKENTRHTGGKYPYRRCRICTRENDRALRKKYRLQKNLQQTQEASVS